MKVAVMQPYVFPYLPYFQLINCVDTFVFYDDVNFIKGGWINRNNIMVNKQPKYFTIPLSKSSSNRQIKEIEIDLSKIQLFKIKFLKTLYQTYKKAPYFDAVYPLIEDFLMIKDTRKISNIAVNSVLLVVDYLELEVEFKISSESFKNNNNFNSSVRLIEFCKELKAQTYVNPIGGADLYSKDSFLKDKIDLKFLKSKEIIYSQFDNDFIPNLSIIDVLMFNSIKDIQVMLNKYKLV